MTATAIRRAGLAALALLASGAGAVADHLDARDIQAPLYPEIIAPTDDSWSGDPGLSTFRRQVVAAGEALVQTEQGRLYDPAALLPFLDDRVEILVGKGWRADSRDFASEGTFAPLDALERLGALTREGGSADPEVRRRHGMREVGRQTGEPTEGRRRGWPVASAPPATAASTMPAGGHWMRGCASAGTNG